MSDFNTKDGHQLSTVRLNGSNASNQSINTNHNIRCSFRCIPVPAHSDTIVLSSVLFAWPGIHFTHSVHFHLYHLNLNLSGGWQWVEARPLKTYDMAWSCGKYAKFIIFVGYSMKSRFDIFEAGQRRSLSKWPQNWRKKINLRNISIFFSFRCDHCFSIDLHNS